MGFTSLIIRQIELVDYMLISRFYIRIEEQYERTLYNHHRFASSSLSAMTCKRHLNLTWRKLAHTKHSWDLADSGYAK